MGGIALAVMAVGIVAWAWNGEIVMAVLLGLVWSVAVVIHRITGSEVDDEVLDYGSFLLVIRRGQKERIEISDILDARSENGVVIRLVKPSKFGHQISFPAAGCSEYDNGPADRMAKDLRDRAALARGAKTEDE